MNFLREECIILFEIQECVSVVEIEGLSCCMSSLVMGLGAHCLHG